MQRERYRIDDEVPMGSPRGMFANGVGHRWARAFVSRRFHEPGGMGYQMRMGAGLGPLEMPRDAAGYRVMGDGKPEWVTWAEIHAERARRQRERLGQIRGVKVTFPRRAQLWVFLNSGWLYSGWHVYVRYWNAACETRDRVEYLGYRGGYDDERIAAELFDLLPMGAGESAGDYLMPPPIYQRVNVWCEAFTKRYPKRKTKSDPRKAGLLNGWTDARSFFLDRAAAVQAVAERGAGW